MKNTQENIFYDKDFTQFAYNRKIAVIGLGYVGLPVVVALGMNDLCIGFDVNQDRIAQLKNGIDLTNEVESDVLKKSNILFTNNIDDLLAADFYIVAVPTPVDHAHTPDLKPLEAVSKTIAKVLKKGDIVVYESTVYPGVTEDICVPILSDGSNLQYISDFKVGYSPERINPGDKNRSFKDICKLVAGCDDESRRIIASVYAKVVTAGVYLASSIKVAEAAKVIENTQRDINIALMNELSVIFERMQIDTTEVLRAAATKWNFLSFKPGLVGGHCIGVDPYYLTHKAEILGYIPQVILAGRRINDNMGRYVARLAVKKLIKYGGNIQNAVSTVLGITFKENCPDIRNTKVIDIIKELQDYNLKVNLHDPLASNEDLTHEYQLKLSSWESLPKADLLIIAVAHDSYKNIDYNTLSDKLNDNAIIFDVKSILDKERLLSLGYRVYRL